MCTGNGIEWLPPRANLKEAIANRSAIENPRISIDRSISPSGRMMRPSHSSTTLSGSISAFDRVGTANERRANVPNQWRRPASSTASLSCDTSTLTAPAGPRSSSSSFSSGRSCSSNSDEDGRGFSPSSSPSSPSSPIARIPSKCAVGSKNAANSIANCNPAADTLHGINVNMMMHMSSPAPFPSALSLPATAGAKWSYPPSRSSTPLPSKSSHIGSMWQHKDILSLNSSPAASASIVVVDPNDQNPLHRVHAGGSVLAIAVSADHIYAGTQNGEIMVFSTETYDHVRDLKGHSGCILALVLSQDESLLFSSAGDAIINIWRTETFEKVHSIYSTFDIGDIFCIAYSQKLSTLYLGAQNTSIQWYDFRDENNKRPKPSLKSHPSRRSHRFFDSLGPGGSASPQPPVDTYDVLESVETHLVEIDPLNIVQYAHFGYVYCMLLTKSFVKDGEEILVSGGGDGSIKIWEIDPATSAIKADNSKSLSSGDCGVLCMATRDQFLYCGLTDGEISIWDLDSQTLIRSIRGHQDDVLTMTVRDNCIWSGSASGYIRKWSQRFELLGRWKAHEGLILASELKQVKGRDLLLSGGNDDCVAIWDVSCREDEQPSVNKTSEDELLSALRKLVSYRTVANDPTFSEDCRQGASLLKSIFRQFGAQSFLIPTSDNRNPIVFARFTPPESTPDSNKQTILFYGHYDVISAGNTDNQWITEPFEMTGMNSYLYGRGVSDNKGPVLAAIFAAGELAQNNLLTSNIVFLIEGEEEAGSRGFKEAVKKYKDFIGPVDWILLANSYWLDDEAPCVTYGLRGVVHASVEICSDRPDLHSGVDGSRESREPVIDMVNLLSKLTSDDGKIMIPNFHEPVRPVTPTEEAMYTEITNSFKNRLFRESIPSQQLKAHLMSRWRYPSLTIHRVNVSGPTNATIIPRSASAAISLRIVPDQTLATICNDLTSYLHEQFHSFASPNQLEISIDHVSEWWLGDPQNKAFKTLARAVEEVWEKKPLFIREGGSIPAVRFLEMEFGASAAHLPCGQASDAAHLDNERMRVTNLYKSKSIMKKVFLELPLGEDEVV
ncbi:hypothetical protein H072_5005 [Dactylellina haptotyla CBS 200.50]|uniref:Peptidase M20 dimerisation domain-containing protein n=1 Tax=Dactylellina haptotyla (strain CBS 200.50) TaxID=1284197 RepID=S8AIW8_DACHA|nr:hypothetical protein H072_5005 [Dactylellina haptotyla CBS 200.50]